MRPMVRNLRMWAMWASVLHRIYLPVFSLPVTCIRIFAGSLNTHLAGFFRGSSRNWSEVPAVSIFCSNGCLEPIARPFRLEIFRALYFSEGRTGFFFEVELDFLS